jgi:hypothetical protein
MNNLRRCPCCKARLIKELSYEDEPFYTHSAGDCVLNRIAVFEDDVEAWNTRPLEDKLVEALEYVLKHGLLKGGDKARQALAEVKS